MRYSPVCARSQTPGDPRWLRVILNAAGSLSRRSGRACPDADAASTLTRRGARSTQAVAGKRHGRRRALTLGHALSSQAGGYAIKRAKGVTPAPCRSQILGRAREGVSPFWRAASTQPRSELIRVEFDAPPRSRPILGRPREEARVVVERHGAAAAAADEPRLLGVVLGDGVPVLRQDERMFALLSRDGTRPMGVRSARLDSTRAR